MKSTKKTTTKSLGKAKPAKSPAKVLKKEASKVPELTTTPASPKTGEQVADITKAANSFEGYKDISQLPFEEQLNHVFNPLHTITKTAVPNKITPSTFVVSQKK